MPPNASGEDIETRLSDQAVAANASLNAFGVEVLAGPERGTRIVVDPAETGRVLVGKSPVCALRLTDPEVSRRHAALESVPRGLRVTDLGSKNGTFVDGLMALDVVLQGGETVRIGETSLGVERLSPPHPGKLGRAMSFGRVIGRSPAMQRLFPLCARLAASDVPLVIEGETGTGKELVAEAIHETSPRAAGPFVVFDCTAVPPNLAESTLFGHEKGSFTGATERHLGVFEQAHGGTLLIDEIGDLELALQAKLLRAIERSEVKRIGGTGFVRVDVRVLAATRRDLDREVQAGRFRDDLFFRLAVARLELPPLRARAGEVAFLARHYWSLHGAGAAPLTDEYVASLEEYSWPGNVRELHNALARRLALGPLAKHEALRPASLSPPPPRAPPPEISSGVTPVAAQGADVVDEILALDLPLPAARQKIVDHFLRRYVERILAKHDGNVVRAASASGIARRYFDLIRARQRR